MTINPRHQKRVARQRKLRSLRALSTKRSVKRNCIIPKTFLHIYALKLELESIRREYLNLISNFTVPKEVRVEKFGRGFRVRLLCEKRRGRLVSILEGFDKMGVDVLQAKVSCEYLFSMEAIVAPREGQELDVSDVTQAMHKAIEKEEGSLEVHEVKEDKCSISITN